MPRAPERCRSLGGSPGYTKRYGSIVGPKDRHLPCPVATLPPTLTAVSISSVKTMSFKQMKRQQAQSRMAAASKARRGSKTAAALQHRASLVGSGAKWRITNLNEVARAIAKWA